MTPMRATPQARVTPQARAGAAGPLSLTRILHILEILSHHEDGQSLADLCRALEAPRSSTFALIRPLVALGYLARDAGRYRLGPAALRLALGIVGTRDADQIIHSILTGLSDRTELTVMYSEFLRDEAVFVHRSVIQSRRAIRFMANVGQRRPLLTTAGGRAVLASCDGPYIRQQLDGATAPKLRPGTAARKRFEALLARVREQGFAASLGEFSPDVGAVASPVLDTDGRPIGSIAAAGPVAQVAADVETIGRAVAEAARRLSQAAGILTSGAGGRRS